jgi:hypothetical protein
MSEAQTMTRVLTEMASGVVDEPLDAVQWFHPGERWNAGPIGLRRLQRLVSGHTRIDDRLPNQSVLIITATRVIVYTCGTATGRFALRELVGAWPRPQVSATCERVETFQRLTLTTPDGELVADLPASQRATTKVSRALTRGLYSPQPWTRSTPMT